MQEKAPIIGHSNIFNFSTQLNSLMLKSQIQKGLLWESFPIQKIPHML
jgi:hypothetical protein